MSRYACHRTPKTPPARFVLARYADRTIAAPVVGYYQSMALIKIAKKQLEYVWHGPGPEEAPTLVFLHEGLGCVAMWREFPRRLPSYTKQS